MLVIPPHSSFPELSRLVYQASGSCNDITLHTRDCGVTDDSYMYTATCTRPRELELKALAKDSNLPLPISVQPTVRWLRNRHSSLARHGNPDVLRSSWREPLTSWYPLIESYLSEPLAPTTGTRLQHITRLRTRASLDPFGKFWCFG